jgi:hypothetical protein
MKKILRLVTTSVLTLTLVACGEASSSVSSSVSSSSASSSVASSSVASSFAAVTSITLTPAATDALTQVVGSLKTVVINASFNAGVNPDLRVTWLVDGVASQQTGRAFEFTPTAAGVFKIKARVGTVDSQEQTVTVTAQGTVSTAVTITSHTFVSSERLEVVATGGAKVTLTGATLDKTASYYDLEANKYVLILDEALEQGDSVKVTLTKEGFTTAEQTFTFDTRKVELDTAKATLNTTEAAYKAAVDDGTVTVTASKITIVRPHILNADGNINQSTTNWSFPVKVTDLDGEEVPFSVTRTSAPAGAVASPVNQGSVDIDGNKLANSASIKVEVALTRETPLGDYVYSIRVGEKTLPLTISVVDTTPTLELEKDLAATGTVGTPGSTKTTFQVTQNSDQKLSSVTATGTDKDVFEVTKDYVLASVDYKTVKFSFEATNISVPANLLGTVNQNNSVRPNQMLVSLAGPGGISFMRVDTTAISQDALPLPVAFRNYATIDVVQKIDNSTPVGDYVYTVRILQLGSEIHRESITVTVKAPEAKLSFAGTMSTPSVMQKDDVLTGMLYHPDTTLNSGMDFIVASQLADATTLTSPSVGDRYFDTDKFIYEYQVTTPADPTADPPVVAVFGWVKLTGSTTPAITEGDLLFVNSTRTIYKAESDFEFEPLAADLPASGDIITFGSTSNLSTFNAYVFPGASAVANLEVTDQLYVTNTTAYKFNGTEFTNNSASRGWKQLESGFILQSSGDIFQITKTNNTIAGDDIDTESNKYFLDSKAAQVYELNGSGDYVIDSNNLVSVPATTPTITIIAKRGTKPTGSAVKAGDYWFDTSNNVLELAGGSPVAYAQVTPAQAPVGTRILVDIGTGNPHVANHEIYVAYDKDLSNETYLQAEIGWKVYRNHNFAFLKNAETETSFETYQLLTRASTDTGVWTLNQTPYNSVKEVIENEGALQYFNGSSLADLLDVSMLAEENLLFIESNKLRVTVLKAESKDVSLSTILRVTRPSFAFNPTSEIALKFDATIANFQSPLNPTAPAATSFTAAANAAGIAGTRELVTFQKSYTGPQTLATSNVADKKVGLVNLNGSTTTYLTADTNPNTVTGVLNRVTGANQEEFDLINGAKASAKLTNAFVFNVTNTTTLGTYVFTMTVGPLTQSFTVVVEAPKQDIVLFVEDTINERMLSPTSAGVIAINLDKDNKVQLNYGIKLLNMEKATDPQTINYILTRSYSFGTTKWNDLKEDVFEGVTVTEQSATLLAPDSFLRIIQGTESHVDTRSILTLTEPGTYTYKLQIGSVVESWSVVVSKFPTLEIQTATLGTETKADSNVLAIMQSIEAKLDRGISTVIIVEERTEDDGEGGSTNDWSDLFVDDMLPGHTDVDDEGRVDLLDHLYLNVKGVNLPAGKIYFQVANDDSAPVLNDTTDKEVTFDVVTGIATIKMTGAQLGLEYSDFEFTEYVEVYVHIYNSSKQAIGFTSFILAVQDIDYILSGFGY